MIIQMHCSCGSSQFDNNGFVITCMDCGLQQQRISLQDCTPGYNQSHSVLKKTFSYSRRYRFETLLLKVFCLHVGPKNSDPIWDYLKRNGPYKNSKEILKTLSNNPSRIKRYNYLTIFTKVFCPNDLPKQKITQQTISRAMQYFDCLESRWAKLGIKRFFSYLFLIEKIFIKLGLHDFLRNTKKLMCKRRRAFYEKFLELLGGIELTTKLPPGSLAALKELLCLDEYGLKRSFPRDYNVLLSGIDLPLRGVSTVSESEPSHEHKYSTVCLHGDLLKREFLKSLLN